MFTEAFEKTAMTIKPRMGNMQLFKTPTPPRPPRSKWENPAKNLTPKDGAQPKLKQQTVDNRVRTTTTGKKIGDLGAGGKVNS